MAIVSPRCRREDGFTLIELLIVLVILGVLLAIAVPSYLGFRDRAADNTAKANIRAAFPAATTYGTENDGSAADADGNAATTGFEGMTVVLLKGYDAGLSATVGINSAAVTSFCLTSSVAGHAWSAAGPGIASFANNATCS
jgi:type IV pilus assembly protein PilA